MTCSQAHPVPRGPLSAGTKKMSSAIGSLLSGAVREAEIEFRMYDVWRAFRAWLLEAAFQLITAGVMPASYSRLAKLRASSAWSDLRTTFSLASWIDPSNDQSMARDAMLVSSSCDMPIPIGI